SGPAEDSLRQLAERLGVADSVTFAGPVGQDELPSLLARHDVFCLPSFAEGVPVVLMEAMAVGLPVVSTQIAGVPELVTDWAVRRASSSRCASAYLMARATSPGSAEAKTAPPPSIVSLRTRRSRATTGTAASMAS